jgi:hypothetical protein
MCRLVFHEAHYLAFVVEKFTEHQLPQSGTPYLPSPIRADGQPQPVADIATNGCLGSFVGEIWWLASRKCARLQIWVIFRSSLPSHVLIAGCTSARLYLVGNRRHLRLLTKEMSHNGYFRRAAVIRWPQVRPQPLCRPDRVKMGARGSNWSEPPAMHPNVVLPPE